MHVLGGSGHLNDLMQSLVFFACPSMQELHFRKALQFYNIFSMESDDIIHT